MSKKIPALVVLAALGTEVALNELHEPAVHQQPHVESEVRSPVENRVTADANNLPPATGGVIEQISATPTPHRKDAPVQPHIESGGNPITDFTLNQIA